RVLTREGTCYVISPNRTEHGRATKELAIASRAIYRRPMHPASPLPRTALLTGVGRRRGIGAAIAHGLAADGYDLALNYHAPYDQRVLGEPADVELLAEELREQGRSVVLVPGDLEDPAAPAAVVDAAREALGTLGAHVTCHCESVDSSILDTTVESFDRHYAVNVRATWLLLKAFAEQ